MDRSPIYVCDILLFIPEKEKLNAVELSREDGSSPGSSGGWHTFLQCLGCIGAMLSVLASHCAEAMCIKIGNHSVCLKEINGMEQVLYEREPYWLRIFNNVLGIDEGGGDKDGPMHQGLAA